MSKPNVLWICTDQQRFDTLGCYGNEFVETPNIDRLANGGIRFNRAFCQSPVCTPSRASFLTGRYPRTTRCRQNGQTIPDDEYLITKRFADEGYTCGLSGKLHLAPAHPEHEEDVRMMERRTDDGYADFHWSHSDRGDLWPTNEYRQWLRENGAEYDEAYRGTPFQGSEYVKTSFPKEHHQTTWCAEKAVTFIEENESHEAPWVFSANIFDPHTPFNPPEEYLERYLDRLDKIPTPNYEEGELEDKPFFQPIPSSVAKFPFEEMSDEDHQLLRAAYWAMIDLIDDQVGRMLDALERTGQREDTIVIFMSDHGEMLGDHGIYLKGPYFYEEAIRVPLIFSWPGMIKGERVSNALVELTDLAPTLLDAAGLEHHRGIQGRSLWPILSGASDIDNHRESIYCEYYHALERPEFYDEMQQNDIGSEFHLQFEESDVLPDFHDEFHQHDDRILPYCTMIRTDRYKLVRVHGLDTGELYDLQEDPTETYNRYHDPNYRDVRVDLTDRLADRMAQTVDPLPQRLGRF